MFETAAQLREIATLSRETFQFALVRMHVRVRVRTLYIMGSLRVHDGFILYDYYVITMR